MLLRGLSVSPEEEWNWKKLEENDYLMQKGELLDLPLSPLL